ncbi:helix-turn-helix domain-containing protein [Methanospirillum sp. J.3.6.1-F.2.7.3]|uniref:Helix-turn-helix domain-containing protein n=1 Tax=Methanospirillum purgamenti TaxID=2834276 RepID=A0A8E7AZP5_9EURY|nr:MULTISPECIES: helix-turn-helix domain-containing protein [Methanospirillum]MDX8550247.1 helix-turn-helix domain-containing protein [Methanospirillum hungatei]NLW75732.1 helix-turn-helix domain-containing protein [Methanomicrobiales archaeon]QVV90365.1 helix-turn-helix domain-containing protein [Methanospirillum sp. J.3.6.1-F.2.7.3]
MSEGLEILHLISQRGGCLLSELATELGIPKNSVQSWVSMLCSTGYLKRDGEELSECSCRKSGMKCVCCHCSCEEKTASSENRIELTERGRSLIRRKWDEKTGSEIISGNGRLSRNNICTQ